VLPSTTAGDDVQLYHLHMSPQLVRQDLNTLLPLQPLRALAASGEVGRAATSHYSYMGYLLQPEMLLAESVPAMIRQMKDEGVNVVVLVPG
jgi:D-proline reductase (dithiol) PrdB